MIISTFGCFYIIVGTMCFIMALIYAFESKSTTIWLIPAVVLISYLLFTPGIPIKYEYQEVNYNNLYHINNYIVYCDSERLLTLDIKNNILPSKYYIKKTTYVFRNVDYNIMRYNDIPYGHKEEIDKKALSQEVCNCK